MSISGISSVTNPNQAAYVSPFAQAKQDMQALGTALNSGSLSDAQQAYAQLQQNLPAAGNSQNGQNSDSASGTIQSIGSALQSGNITDAQQAFAKLQSAKGAGKAHHHHHKGGGSQAGAAAGGTSQSGTTQPNTYTASGLGASSSDKTSASGASGTVDITLQLDITA